MANERSNPERNASASEVARRTLRDRPEGRAAPFQTAEHDRLLLHRVRASDAEALDELVDLTWEALVSYAERIVGSLDAAEDVAQESFVRLWAARASWDAGASAHAILYRITRNLALDERRKKTVRERNIPLHPMVQPTAPSPLELAEASELRRSLEAALDALSDRDREIFTLSRFHGLSPSEIAKVLGLAPQTVSNLLTRILSSLRRRLSPFLADGHDPKVLRLPRRRA